jgi:SAM-dependent methyltransferase
MTYSLENAKRCGWSSIGGELNGVRVSHLDSFLVGERILEAGCGGGGYVDFLSRKGLEVVGVDRHDEFLRVAQEQGFRGRYLQADITRLPFGDKTFDCTYSFDVLEHVDDVLAIKELARVTVRRLIITVPLVDDAVRTYGLTFPTFTDPTHLRYYTEASVRELCETVGNSGVNIMPEGHLPLNRMFEETLERPRPLRYTREILKLRSSGGLLYRILAKVNDLIVTSLLDFDAIPTVVFNQASFRSIYPEVVAVVDLK